MKASTLTDRLRTTESSTDDQMTDALVDAVKSNDTTIEIRPAQRSTGMGLARFLLLVGAAVGVAYWMRNSRKPNQIIESAKQETADRTREVSEQAAETIQQGSETASERIEEGSQRASDMVEEAAEKAAEETEGAGEKVGDEVEDSGSTFTEQ